MNTPTYEELMERNTDMIPEEFKHKISDAAAEFCIVMLELLNELSDENTSQEELMELYLAGTAYFGKCLDSHIDNITEV